MSDSPFRDRLAYLRRKLDETDLDGVVISQPENRFYLSGFSGSSGLLLITKNRAAIFVDGRYWEQVGQESPDLELIRQTRTEPYADQLAKVLPGLGRTLGFEAAHITVAQQEDWLQKVPGVEWQPTRQFVETLREVKDESEIQRIRTAARITDGAVRSLASLLEPGMMEDTLSWRLERWMRENGAEEMAFGVSVSSGLNTSKPHAHGGKCPLANNEPVWIDLGAKKDHYCSDMTRAFWFGDAVTERYRAVWELVRQAQEESIAAIRPGVAAAEVDRIARSRIEEAGYGYAFSHALGHGVGLEIHESPSISPLSQSVLTAGMVITIEPGIYLPGWGGVRIEDLLLIREDGVELLSHAEKRLAWE